MAEQAGRQRYSRHFNGHAGARVQLGRGKEQEEQATSWGELWRSCTVQRRGQKGGSIDDREIELSNLEKYDSIKARNSGKILKNLRNPWKSLSRAVNPVKHSIRLSHCDVKAKKQMKFCSIPSAGSGGAGQRSHRRLTFSPIWNDASVTLPAVRGRRI